MKIKIFFISIQFLITISLLLLQIQGTFLNRNSNKLNLQIHVLDVIFRLDFCKLTLHYCNHLNESNNMQSIALSPCLLLIFLDQTKN